MAELAEEKKVAETAEEGAVKVDLDKVERLQRWIIIKENQNIKSGANKDTEMIKAIRSKIEEEVNAIKVN